MSQHTIGRVFLIGIDGGTFDVLDPLMQAGHMPTLRRLVANSGRGILRSTVPPITGPAWRTFATGCNPGKHGVIDFVELDPKTHTVHVKDVSSVPIPTFWDELGHHGKTVGIVGVPMTYPPNPVNGYLLSGLMTPPGSRNYSFPPDLGPQLESVNMHFPTSAGERANAFSPDTYIEQVINDVRKRVDVACHLLNTQQPDCAVFVFGATDPIQHQFFHLLGPTGTEAGTGTRSLLGQFYRAVDDGIRRLLTFVDDRTLVMVVSDHGFGPLKGFIHLNNWLLQRGHLYLRKDPLTRVRYRAFQSGLTPENIYRLTNRLGVDVRRRMNRGRVYSLAHLGFLSFANVDWSRTRAYALGHIGQVYVVRQPGMSEEDYEDLRQGIRQELLEMRHPVTSEPLIAQVHLREELYHGPYVERAPDLILEPRGYEHVAFGESEFASNRIVSPALHSGHHRPDGILVVKGAGVRPGVELKGASIADIAPTILYALGLAVPDRMDGRALQEAFTSEFISQHGLKGSAEKMSPQGPTSDPAYTAHEEDLVRHRLRDLGYIA